MAATPMPTIYDVAKRAGVSTYTVSSVINQSAYVSPELTKRVLKAVRDVGLHAQCSCPWLADEKDPHSRDVDPGYRQSVLRQGSPGR